MAKGLARQVKSWYPAAPSAIRIRYPPDIGSVLIYFDPISERYIFSLVTKSRYYHKPTYESVLLKPGLQYVILCDASYHGAGFVLMVEDYVNETGKKRKHTLPFRLDRICLMPHN